MLLPGEAAQASSGLLVFGKPISERGARLLSVKFTPLSLRIVYDATAS